MTVDPLDGDIWCDPHGLVADIHHANNELEDQPVVSDGSPE
jgi:hypothetical protein